MHRCVFVLVLLSLLAGWSGPAAAQSQEVPVTFVSILDGRAAWLYVGMEQGYFPQEGLNVRVQRGYGGDRSSLLLDQGQFLFAVNIDLSTLLALRQKGSKLKAIMVTNAHSPFGLQAFADKGLRTPKNLEGLTVGIQPGTAADTLFRAFVRVNNLDSKRVRVVPLTQDVYISAFMSGRTDVISGFYDGLYQPTRIKVEKEGKKLSALWYKDWGLDAYGGLIIAREETLQKQPDLVRKFVRAAKKSRDAAKADPAGAIRMMARHLPEINSEAALAQLVAHVELTDDGATPMGCASMQRLQKSVDVYKDAFSFPTPMSAKDAFTNDYMPWCTP